MKHYFTLFLVFALVAALFVGCGGKDNVSHNENGMIESNSTESVTVPTTQNTTASTSQTESNGLMEDMLPDDGSQGNGNGGSSGGGNGGSDSGNGGSDSGNGGSDSGNGGSNGSGNGGSNGNGRSRRGGTPRF